MLEKYEEFTKKNKVISDQKKQVKKKLSELNKKQLLNKLDKYNKKRQEISKQMTQYVNGSSNYE